jgi:enoyl-CoA hydratase/carnithine racemase
MEKRMNSVQFDTLPCADGKAIGVATLNNPAILNALTLEMIERLDAQLDEWARDDRIVCVLLKGAGDRAFCAGGDVRSLRAALIDGPKADPHPFTTRLFTAEYTLDYRIHTYEKPLIVWGHGIVMGGGLGLLAGARYRVLTPQSRLAMPEISIGLYPDVGGSWFLPRMPGRLGLFLALTGAALTAEDALFTGLGDYILHHAQLTELTARLTENHWSPDPDGRHAQVGAWLAAMETHSAEPAPIIARLDTVRRLMMLPSLNGIAQAFAENGFEDSWLAEAAHNFLAGSPTTAALCWAIFPRARHLSLAEVFRLELILSVNLCARPDFTEGVRALLVDKDRTPNWCRGLADIDDAWIDSLFHSPWPQNAHPLAELERVTGNAGRRQQ